MTDAAATIAEAWSLRCRRLSVRRGTHLALRDVDLTLGPDQCLSVVGPNGSGKTTLLLTLLGLLRPSTGTVELGGRDVARLPPRQRARFAAYVPQVIDTAPAFTVADVVAGGRFAHVGSAGRLGAADHEEIARAMALCGVESLAARTFDTLSGGERQKTLLAAAIAQDPRVLMLDEPNAALDPRVQIDLVRILRDWQSDERSLVVISHDLQLPAALGGCVVALRHGTVAAAGAAAEVLTAERLGAVYDAPFGVATTADGRTLLLPAWWTG